VLIQIEAASLNFPDLLIVQNKYQMKPELPFVPGSEYAGKVQAVGEGVTHLKVGQSVACLSGTGGFGTHTLAPAKLCMPLPSWFSGHRWCGLHHDLCHLAPRAGGPRRLESR
jgi:NADPH:quinone reductase